MIDGVIQPDVLVNCSIDYWTYITQLQQEY
jgi:hypothetical protein